MYLINIECNENQCLVLIVWGVEKDVCCCHGFLSCEVIQKQSSSFGGWTIFSCSSFLDHLFSTAQNRNNLFTRPCERKRSYERWFCRCVRRFRKFLSDTLKDFVGKFWKSIIIKLDESYSVTFVIINVCPPEVP